MELRRFPVLTLVVAGVTAAVGVAQFFVPGLLEHLGRAPSGLHGEWWRSFTSMFVQDGGVLGTVVNVGFLVVLGVLAEQVLSWPRWLVCYFGAGLVGEVAGYAWQPHGGGNSVANCGLAAALAVALWVEGSGGERVLPRGPVAIAVVMWCSALALPFPWVVVPCAAVIPAVQVMERRGLPLERIVLGVAVVVGVGLSLVADLHGAALVAGLVLAALIVVPAVRGRRGGVAAVQG